MVETSPVRTKEARLKSAHSKTQMDFGSAMRRVAKGRHVRRLEWEDEKVRVALIEEKLMIFLTEGGAFHPLIVNAGDLHGKDWIVTDKE